MSSPYGYYESWRTGDKEYNSDFEDWYSNHASEYDDFWKKEKTEKEDAYKAWKKLQGTYAPIIGDLQTEYDSLTKLTKTSHYRPEIGYQIQAAANKGENMFAASTQKLFNTKAGKSMVESSGVNKALTNIHDNFEDMMGTSVYNAYAGTAGKISGVKDLQRTIQGDIRNYERKMI